MQEFRIFRALGLSFRMWFKNFIPFTLLAAVLYSPVVLWVMTYDPQNADSAEALMDAYFERPIYFLIGLSALLPPLLTYRLIQDLNGIRVSMLTSIKFGLRGILPAVFLAVITGAIQYVPGGGIAGAVVMCIWFVASPAAVAEKLGPFAAFSRSAQLTAGRRWGIFGLTLLLGIMLVGLLLFWLIPLLQGIDSDPEAIAQLKWAGIMFVPTMGVFHLFTGIVEAVSYALLRQDKEGASYQDLAKIFE
jgi:hypothetical protein